MTDNEKAATFIGWNPHEMTVMDCWMDKEGNLAPDMSDPRNYMKALESPLVVAFTIRYERDPTELASEPAHWWCWIIYNQHIDDKGVAHGNDVSHAGMVRADAIVGALAALYDAQQDLRLQEKADLARAEWVQDGK